MYRFLNAIYSSYDAPEIGTPGPVEEITYVSFPGNDDQFYQIPDGHTVPNNLVAEFDLHNAALQTLKELPEGTPSPPEGHRGEVASDRSSPALTPPTPAQRPRPRSPSPEFPESAPESESPKRYVPSPHQNNAYVLVPERSYRTKQLKAKVAATVKSGGSGDCEAEAQKTGKSHNLKGKGRYIQSDSEEGSEEESSEPDNSQDEDFKPDEHEHSARNGDTSIDNNEDGFDPIENKDEAPGDREDNDSIVNDDNEQCEAGKGTDIIMDEAAESGEEVVREDEIPEAWKKGGRPTKAFVREAAALGEVFDKGFFNLRKQHGVSAKLAFSAVGYHPITVERREGSSWNAHQRDYKINCPKAEGETKGEYSFV